MSVADGMQEGQSVVAGAGEDAVAEAIAELGAAMEGVCARWRGRTDDALRATLGEVVPGMVRGMVAGVAAEAEAVRHGDGGAVARAAQRAVQPVGAAFIQGTWRFQGHAAPLPPEQRPCCASCGRKMKLVRDHRSRHLLGRCGPYTLERSYYTGRARNLTVYALAFHTWKLRVSNVSNARLCFPDVSLMKFSMAALKSGKCP